MIIQGKFVELSSDINDNIKMLKEFVKWEIYTIKDFIIYAGIIIFLLVVTFWLVIKALFMKYVFVQSTKNRRECRRLVKKGRKNSTGKACKNQRSAFDAIRQNRGDEGK